MDEPKRRRGRPRKESSISNTSEGTFESKDAIDNAIDKTEFEFYEPSTTETPEVNVFNPLSESPIERDYSTPKIQEGVVVDLDEPSFHQKSFDEIKKEQQASPTSSKTQSPIGTTQDPTFNPNPAVNQLDDAEKRLACEQMVDAALDTYDTLCTLGAAVGKVKEEKVNELISSGKIDKNRRMTIDEYGNSVTITEFVQQYNAQVGEAVKPDPSFRKKVRPPMVRVFTKRGWGMTDEQFLLFAFGKDISLKAVTLFSMKKGINDILKQLMAENAKTTSAFNPPSQNTPPPSTPPPPPPSPVYPIEPNPNNDILTAEGEDISDDELEYFDRVDEAVALQEEIKEAEENKGVQKLKIKFEDNPLRDKTKREPPAPKVTETFIKGGEI